VNVKSPTLGFGVTGLNSARTVPVQPMRLRAYMSAQQSMMAFGKEYDLSLELACRLCGSYGACDCEVSDLEKF
jgi:hypothetical protein